MKRTLSNHVHRKIPHPAERAETMAGEILGFLAADDERMGRFFGLTGMDVETLRAATRAPGFAESMLDYLTADEPLLVAFAADHGYDPARIEAIRMSLSPASDDV